MISALAVASVVVAACGVDDGDGGDGGSGGDGQAARSGDAGEVTVEALDTLRFDRDSYTADAGEVTITYENGGSLVHTLLIDGVDDYKLQVSANGDTDRGTVDLDPGGYRIYCDVPGHSSMEATLTVE